MSGDEIALIVIVSTFPILAVGMIVMWLVAAWMSR